MYVLTARNVSDALPAGVRFLLEQGVREESRAGPVLVSPHPVTTLYTHPRERVLTNPVRDANPFFHLMEALWMLAGRSDAAFLDQYVKNFGERFGEPGVPSATIHGAYGHRWRRALGFDQLGTVVEKLRADPTSRQCVLQMWDAAPGGFTMPNADKGDDTMFCTGCDDLRGTWRDRPCNTHAYLRMRDVTYREPVVTDQNSADWEARITRGDTKVLDLTVCCRSNDIIMGAYGANAVHFSVLQEYLAARIGVGVGRYYQVSNNYHAYETDLERLCARGKTGVGAPRAIDRALTEERHFQAPAPLVTLPDLFDRDLRYMLDVYDCLGEGPPDSAAHAAINRLESRFLAEVAWPVMMAHVHYRAKSMDRWLWAARIADAAWMTAVTEWMERRQKP